MEESANGRLEFLHWLVAELYKPLKAHSQGWEPYASFIAHSGQPALELGCGDGDPILDLRRNGLVVDGVDSSSDMLRRCTLRAAQEGLDVVLHHQRMEELDLPNRYRSIFLAGPTFTLLPDEETALQALKGIRKHLTNDGSALVPLFIPSPTPQNQLGKIKEATTDDGAILRVSVLSEDRNEDARIRETLLRYEKRVDGESFVEDRPWILHWHSQESFRVLVEKAGLNVSAINNSQGRSAAPGDSEFTFLLSP